MYSSAMIVGIGHSDYAVCSQHRLVLLSFTRPITDRISAGLAAPSTLLPVRDAHVENMHITCLFWVPGADFIA